MRISRLALVLALGALACVPSNKKNGNTEPQCSDGFELCDGECVEAGTCGGGTTSGQQDTSTGQNTSTGTVKDTDTGVASNTGTTSASKTNTGTGTKSNTTVTQTPTNTATASATVTKAPASPNCTDVSYTAPYQQKGSGVFSRLTTPAGKEYIAGSNWWKKVGGAFIYKGQTVDLDGLSALIGNPQGVSSPDNDPIGYPSFFIGTYQGRTTAQSNLPIQVSAIKTVNTIFSTNAGSKGTSNYNAAYDVWFTPTSATLASTAVSPPPGGAYVMVWLFMPSNRQPRGSNEHPGHTVTGIPGSWDVWVDHSNPPCISYVSKSNLEVLDFDLNKFIQDAANNSYGYSTADWKNKYLSVIFAGFEIWGGGDGLRTKAFCADVK